MKFAFAITEYFPFGGAQRDFFAVASEMAERGHEITVITAGWQGAFPKNWQLILVDKTKFKTNHARLKALSEKVVELKCHFFFDAVIGFTKMVGLDIYYAADPSFIANRYFGLKKVLPRYRTYAGIEYKMFSNPDLKVFFLTDYQCEQYLSLFALEKSQFRMLPVTVEPEFHYDDMKFKSARDWRASQMTRTDNILLLFVAADFHTKGLDLLINSLANLKTYQLRHFELWIVGNGKQEVYEKELQKLPNLQFKFWGGQLNTAQFYFAADLLVHPARKEAAGMVIAESMASRLPAYISDVCGYKFLLEEDPSSKILSTKNIVSELSVALKKISNSNLVRNGKRNSKISDIPRAVFCADEIEKWLTT